MRRPRLFKAEAAASDVPRARWHRPYCAVTPAALRTGVQRATSLSTSFCSACGPRAAPSGMTPPSSNRRLRVPSSESALSSASTSLPVISFGVPFGAKTAFQAETSYYGSPPSFAVGTSGSEGERSGVAMAIALMFFDWICGTRLTIWSQPKSTCPPTRSFSAGPVPR